MKMISITDAMDITGHACRRSFASWLDRYNRRNPGHLIFRRYGKVDKHSLLEALKYETQKRSAE